MKTRPQIKLHNPIVTNACVSLLQSLFEIHFVSTNKKATTQHPTGCRCYSPKTRIFLPDGNLDLDRVETSLSMEDLEEQQSSRVIPRHRASAGCDSTMSSAHPHRQPRHMRAIYKPGLLLHLKTNFILNHQRHPTF